jgi:hypothetical protein
MATNEAKNEMLVMVLSDLAAICKKLSENSALPGQLRTEASQFLEEFNSLLPYRGRGTPAQHFQGEALLSKMARFLPRLLEVQAAPASSGN